MKCKTKARKTKEMNNTVAAINKAFARVNSSGERRKCFSIWQKGKITNGVSSRIKSSKEPPCPPSQPRTDSNEVSPINIGVANVVIAKPSNPMIRWHRTTKRTKQMYNKFKQMIILFGATFSVLRSFEVEISSKRPTNVIKSNSNFNFNSIHANVFVQFHRNLFYESIFFSAVIFDLDIFFLGVFFFIIGVFWLGFLRIAIFIR